MTRTRLHTRLARFAVRLAPAVTFVALLAQSDGVASAAGPRFGI